MQSVYKEGFVLTLKVKLRVLFVLGFLVSNPNPNQSQTLTPTVHISLSLLTLRGAAMSKIFIRD